MKLIDEAITEIFTAWNEARSALYSDIIDAFLAIPRDLVTWRTLALIFFPPAILQTVATNFLTRINDALSNFQQSMSLLLVRVPINTAISLIPFDKTLNDKVMTLQTAQELVLFSFSQFGLGALQLNTPAVVTLFAKVRGMLKVITKVNTLLAGSLPAINVFEAVLTRLISLMRITIQLAGSIVILLMIGLFADAAAPGAKSALFGGALPQSNPRVILADISRRRRKPGTI